MAETVDPGQVAEQESDRIADRCTDRFFDTILRCGHEITRDQVHACMKAAAMQGYGAGFIAGSKQEISNN